MGIDWFKMQKAAQDSEKMSKELTTLCSELKKSYEEIVEKLNWVMTTQQEICNSLKIKLEDPLEK